ncbi:hypothetical protein ON010_g11209 [Phytophthora cinnamomi]|nr:hypothetical protein ON010_g11209 [Phytophthora cinnamomi]
MYRELIISSGVPAHKLRKTVESGKLSLTAAELAGTGAKLHLHPESHEKALKVKKGGRGVRLHITNHEIKKRYKKAQGGSIMSKIWSEIKSGFKFAKALGLLSKATDAATPALATAVGQPELAVPARAGIKALTGVGVVISDVIDEGERFLHSMATQPDHRELTNSVRNSVRRRYGVGVATKRKSKFAKGSPEAKAHMAKLRSMRKSKSGGSFTM